MVYLIGGLVILSILVIAFIVFAGITFKGLPVLMYHKVIDSGTPDSLAITTEDLERQFRYLIKKNYTPIFLSDLHAHLFHHQTLPSRAVMITFDDGYKNNYTCLYPLLEKYGLKANIFLVAGFIVSDSVGQPKSEFLHIDEINKMSKAVVEFGLHSYDHKNYNELTISEIEEDIRNCKTLLNSLNVPYQPCLAYTYGAYPKKDHKKRDQMFRTMEATGIKFAFRIGNRLNKIPLMNRFLIQRIDIRGDDSFRMFKLALAAGKKLLFK